eukprot:CAMPEP_0195508876 /NCGR_PEP_ID=MMETSP0794_2-20130614/1972_1 /TAXON_ID=515487 /ORGANISM="Stephanopyxis turris, Strain CCMP 815" /LENGTH=163 /DNA_ID=CAMNT_0040635957 /DNA_START=67 /DNA_END=558 /DNA_ORIENTATION=+
MDEESLTKTVKLPTFSGERKDFQIWWVRFCAYASVQGFRQSIGRVRDPDLPSSEDVTIDARSDQGKKQLRAKRANAVAMANLTMAFTTEALIGMVYQAQTSLWSSGLTYVIVDALHKKYIPKDLVSKIELRRELNAVSMKKDDDPAVLFVAISGIENKYNTSM